MLFNGHLDVVPTGPEALWRDPPFSSRVDDGWPFGRGAGDMKAGLICTLGVRIGFFPDVPVKAAKARVAACVAATIARLASGHALTIRYEGVRASGCEFDLDGPALPCLAAAHQTVHGVAITREATTATTDARHFKLMLDTPFTCYGPEARSIHGIDESVSLASMLRVTTTLAQFLHDWHCPRPVAAAYRHRAAVDRRAAAGDRIAAIIAHTALTLPMGLLVASPPRAIPQRSPAP